MELREKNYHESDNIELDDDVLDRLREQAYLEVCESDSPNSVEFDRLLERRFDDLCEAQYLQILKGCGKG